MEVFKLVNCNILWSFLLLPLLVTLFGVWNFSRCVCIYRLCVGINENLPILLYFSIEWSPSITDTTGIKDFVLYNEVSFAQVDHALLTIVASYAGTRLWTSGVSAVEGF